MKVCRKCKIEYKDEYSFCPKCGTLYEEKTKRAKTPNESSNQVIDIIKKIVNVILYGFGGVLVLASLLTITTNPLSSFITVLLGLSLFQIFYKLIEDKFCIEKKYIIIARFAVPILVLIILSISIPNQSDSQKEPSINNESAPQEQVEEKPCVTFMNEGSEYKEICVNKGETITPPESPVKEGYKFSHWASHQKSIDGSEIFNFYKPITHSITLFAHYDVSIDTKESSSIKDKKSTTQDNDQSAYMTALRKCTVMEAADIYTTGIGQKSDNVFNDARVTCQAFYDQWGEKEFIKTVNIDWKTRKNEKIEGKKLKYYLKVLNW